MYTDKTLTCQDCGQPFTFTAEEQEFFSSKGYSEPKRCPACRQARKAERGGGGGGYRGGGGGVRVAGGVRPSHPIAGRPGVGRPGAPGRPVAGYPGYGRGVAYGVAAGAAAAGAYGYYNSYNNGCTYDSYGNWVCPNQYPY